MNKKNVLLRAPVLSQSGYGVHSRQIARWLLSRDDVELTFHPVQWGITPWYVNPELKDGLVGKIHEGSTGKMDGFDVSFQVQLPNEWDTSLARINVGVTAGVETDICNPEWIHQIQKMDYVIVPSEFVRATFERTASLNKIGLDPGKVKVIPESFIGAILDDVPSLDLDFETSFNFLAVGQITGRSSENDRKNLFNTIKWFCEAFANDEEVGLVLKTNNGRDTKIDRRVTNDLLRQILGQVRKGPFPRVYFVHGSMSDEEVAALYKHPKIKAFVSLTRGEGFGLPILEAAASGLPVIATNWSGHTDFMKLGKFVKIDFELNPIPSSRIDNNIFVPDAKWAEVSENDVKRRLKKFRERNDVPLQWASELQPLLRERYAHDAIVPLYDELLEAIT